MIDTRDPTGPQAGAVNEYLTFRLGDEDYGIDIQRVNEIRGYEAVTRIANAPAYLKGVVNLRGTIVPIVDLRVVLGMGEPGYGPLTVAIILNIGHKVVGIVVDSVSDVIALRSDQVKPAPAFGRGMKAEHITGIGSVDGPMIVLMDIERLLADMGLEDVERQAA